MKREGIKTRLRLATAIDQNRIREAWNARNAVAGPWTAEYGPTGTEKRKMLRVPTSTTIDNSRFTRP